MDSPRSRRSGKHSSRRGRHTRREPMGKQVSCSQGASRRTSSNRAKGRGRAGRMAALTGSRQTDESTLRGHTAHTSACTNQAARAANRKHAFLAATWPAEPSWELQSWASTGLTRATQKPYVMQPPVPLRFSPRSQAKERTKEARESRGIGSNSGGNSRGNTPCLSS